MKQKHLITALIGVASLACSLASCDNGCEQKRESLLHAEFISSSGRALRSMKVIAISGETGYQMSATKFDDVELDLNPHDSLTYFLITGTYTDFGDSFTVTDTVEVEYQVQPHYLDMACGCTIHYNLLAARTTHNLINSIRVADPYIHPESSINMVFEY